MFKAILKTVKQEKTKSTISEQQDINSISEINNKVEKKKFLTFHKIILDYQDYKIKDSIDSIYYFKQILHSDEQDYLMDEIYDRPKRWVDLPHSQRRVQKYGGDVEEKGLMNQEELPEFLKQLSNYCYLDEKNISINHALINEYLPGVGIHPHFDGPLYHNFVNIFSLNSTCVFKFQIQEQFIKLFVEPGSLLIFTEKAYTDWLHGIEYFHDDTILLNIQEDKIINTDLVNFKETLFFEKLQKCENQLQYLNSQPNYELCAINGNNQFNYSLIVKRYQRISITLRHVPLPKQYNEHYYQLK